MAPSEVEPTGATMISSALARAAKSSTYCLTWAPSPTAV